MQETPHQARIFVQIASYRDPECQWTVKDLFEKAAHPERIHVGICQQLDPDADRECIITDLTRPKQVRIVEFHIRDAKGAGWARNHAQKFYNGEEYILQIQAHMRFERNWDKVLIKRLEDLPEKSVLTAWLPGYTPPDKKIPLHGMLPQSFVNKLGDRTDAQIVHLWKREVPMGEMYGKHLLTSSWVGNFLFCRANVLKEVPFDPHIYFWGEEINFSARLWTHGYDIYHLDRLVLYHYWEREEAKDRPKYRNHAAEPNQLSLMRNLHLFDILPAADPRAIVDIEKYPLGAARSLEEYWQFSGVDPMAHTIAQHARKGVWGEGRKTAAGKKERIFVNIASFRDPEINPTLHDLFSKASHPERIHVGICLQIDPKKDEDGGVKTDRPKQVRITQVNSKNSQGANWARALAQELYKNEEYVLQIDSHMRFEPGWDDALIDMLARCPSEKSALSTYVPRYVPPDERTRTPGEILRIRVHEFGEEGSPQLLHLTKVPVPLADSERSGLYRSPFYIANFLFCRADIVKDVPFDPHIQFWGDEITYSARLWTHGIDIYQPDHVVMYHYWRRDELVPIQNYRRMNTPKSKQSLARVKHLLGLEQSEDAQALLEMEQYGLGKKRSLDALWSFAGIDWKHRKLAAGAKQGKWGQAANRGASKGLPVKPTPVPGIRIKASGKKPQIFVNIASYRDPECQWTVKDLFEKAAHPERIHVGICWQFDSEKDQHCFQVSTRPEQVRMLPVEWREAEGVCWARNQAQQLWDGEEYTLMIDSHMRFMSGWDEDMIEELALCNAAKPVLSCSPPRYTPPDKLNSLINPTIRRVKPFMPDGNIRCQGEFLDYAPEQPLNAAFLVANFVFSKSDIIKEVPYDPYLYFDQEEITYAARLYTHGWDIFSPRRQFLYHYYNDQPMPNGQKRRPMHWNDLYEADQEKIRFLRNRGLRRFNHMTRFSESHDPAVTAELLKYGFGRKRTIEQFEEYSGVDFKRKVASEKALRGLFVKDLQKYRSAPIYVPEIDGLQQHLQTNGNAANGQPAKAMAAMPVSIASARPAAILEPGDCMPFIELQDTSETPMALELLAGKPCLLFWLPANDEAYLTRFFASLQERDEKGKHLDAWLRFVLDDTRTNLLALRKKLKTAYHLSADPDRRLAHSFGVCKQNEPVISTAYLLNHNLRVETVYKALPPEELAQVTLKDCRALIAAYHEKYKRPQVITEAPPMLIVPNALTPELCDLAIESFRTGHTYEGTVGAGDKMEYRPHNKVRRDHVPQGDLLRAIDEKLSRSLFPEIEKAFGFDVTFRELYKVGLYTGEKKGFFKQHRDNFEAPLGYRRVAMTLHLTDDYEGGGLVFPEYGRNIYRPKKGAAVAFSCSVMHEALPVTSGERFILVGFFHGDQDEAYRRSFLANKGEPLRIADYTPTRKKYARIKRGRDFFRSWQQERVHYDDLDKKSD